MLLADRLTVPDGTKALLPDLDGVLLDMLGVSYEVVNRLVRTHLSSNVEVPGSVIRANFAYDIPLFWQRILLSVGAEFDQEKVDQLTAEYEEARLNSSPRVFDGVADIFRAAHADGLRLAVVSNNSSAQIDKILTLSGLRPFVDEIVGNDISQLAKKPAPDPYLEAARRLRLPTDQCVVLEDSLIGIQAGSEAGCYTVAVATGANTFDQLSLSPYASRCYTHLAQRTSGLGRGAVLEKYLNGSNSMSVPTTARIERVTKESSVLVEVDLDGSGRVEINTGVPFYDHMLTALGTHAAFNLTVRATGDIGLLKIVSDESIASGVRRIRAVTGVDAYERFRETEILVDEISSGLRTSRSELPTTVSRLQDELKKARREAEELKLKIATGAVGSSSNGDEAREIAGVRVLAREASGLDAAAMRQLSDTLLARIKSGVVVLGRSAEGKVSLIVRTSSDLTSKVPAGQVIKELAPIVGGRGGGKADMAEGGGNQPEKLADALGESYNIIERLLGKAAAT